MTGLGMGGHQSHDAGTVDWITPPEVITALGGADSFDLDPCASATQPFRTARQSYTVAENGLILPWTGKVWLNPPYTSGVIGQWLERMAAHGEGTALIFARTETAAFHRHVWEQCDALLFLEGRLFFYRPDGTKAPHNAGAPSVLCAYGIEEAERLAGCGIDGAFVPLRVRAFAGGFTEVGTWIEEVRKAMDGAGGRMTVDQLYRALQSSRKAKANPNWKAKIRQTLQRGPFAPLGGAQWELEL